MMVKKEVVRAEESFVKFAAAECFQTFFFCFLEQLKIVLNELKNLRYFRLSLNSIVVGFNSSNNSKPRDVACN